MTTDFSEQDMERCLLDLFPVSKQTPKDSLYLRSKSIDEEVVEVTAHFIGKDWNEIESSVWRNDRNAISLMQSKAACYYLPSLIMASLRDINGALGAIEDMIGKFRAGGDPWRRAEWDAAWMSFNPIQLIFIGGWLEWLSETKQLDAQDVRNVIATLHRFIAEHM